VRKRATLNIERRTQKIGGFGVFVLVTVIVVKEMQAAALPR
jgi:hypothetical protein